MGDLSTYRLSDFILFSGSTYYRQFETYNQAIWPLHLVAILFACMVIYSVWKMCARKKPAWAGRVSACVLVISWFWVAYGFLYLQFYVIHVVANWYALGFVLQAGLIAWFGLLKDGFAAPRKNDAMVKIAMFIVLFGVLVYPLIAFFTGRAWLQFEIFALAPDPTALVTLGLLLFYRAHISRSQRILFVIPGTWLVISYTTQYVM